MSRFAGSLLLVVALAALTPDRARALEFTETLASNFGGGAPNVVNLYLAPGGPVTFSTLNAPSFILNGGASWAYNVSTDGSFAQLMTTGTSTGILWDQFFTRAAGPAPAFQLAVQQVQYNFANPSLSTIVGSSTQSFPGAGAAAPVSPPSTLQGPVPEPSTLLIMGLAGLGAAVHARRRRSLPS